MTLVRERRHHQRLQLSLPPPLPYGHLHPSSLSTVNPDSPGINNLSDLEKLQVIGHGNGGTVYKVRHKRTSRIFALKVLRFDYNDTTTAIRQQAAREAEILKRVDSPFIVRCYAVFDSEEDLCFAMEYMEKGSLNEILISNKNLLTEDFISNIARCVLNGLKYLHGMQIVHGDIKPSNLLINGKGEVKIADFGVSHDSGSIEADMGTCAYMSPERLDPQRWDGDNADGFTGDVWSVGVVVMECLVGHYPLIGIGEKPDWAALVCAICFGERLEMPENASPEFRSFVGRCLEKDWSKRGTVDELVHHPFLRNKTCFECDDQGIN
ncbi:mitogen-activated protein kinase kinase 10 [Euphorbia lathyris]|uniref:mitogen-activated protein kinase kinase 10 n=1 Tax=Euphorbia lathyris TaxID=212925 RepID=UPI00331402B1